MEKLSSGNKRVIGMLVAIAALAAIVEIFPQSMEVINGLVGIVAIVAFIYFLLKPKKPASLTDTSKNINVQNAQYILAVRAEGFDDDAIKDNLLKAGWPLVDIEAAFKLTETLA